MDPDVDYAGPLAAMLPRRGEKVPSPDFTAPPPGLGPSWRDPYTPGLSTAKGLAAGAVEPFGQAGRLMTGKSQDTLADIVGAAAAMVPIGPPGATKALSRFVKTGTEAAEAAKAMTANMNVAKGAAANANLDTSARDLLASGIVPPPLSTVERTWQNYTRHMSPDEMLASEPVWGNAKDVAQERGIKEHEGFATLVNDYYARKGMNKFMAPDMARRYMAAERAKYGLPGGLELK